MRELNWLIHQGDRDICIEGGFSVTLQSFLKKGETTRENVSQAILKKSKFFNFKNSQNYVSKSRRKRENL